MEGYHNMKYFIGKIFVILGNILGAVVVLGIGAIVLFLFLKEDDTTYEPEIGKDTTKEERTVDEDNSIIGKASTIIPSGEEVIEEGLEKDKEEEEGVEGVEGLNMQEDLLNKPVGGELTEEERVIFEQELLDTINTQWEHLSVAEFDKPSKTYTITPTTEVFISFIIGSIEGIPETLEMWGGIWRRVSYNIR